MCRKSFHRLLFMFREVNNSDVPESHFIYFNLGDFYEYSEF